MIKRVRYLLAVLGEAAREVGDVGRVGEGRRDEALHVPLALGVHDVAQMRLHAEQLRGEHLPNIGRRRSEKVGGGRRWW